MTLKTDDAGMSGHFDEENFLREMNADLSKGYVSRMFKERYCPVQRPGCRPAWMARRKRRGLKNLSVTVPSTCSNAFGSDGQVKKDVVVNSRMKFFQIREFGGHRPPYRGTFSKSSRILSGRRPCLKDPELFDYDYDSETEWAGESLPNEGKISALYCILSAHIVLTYQRILTRRLWFKVQDGLSCQS